MRQRLEAQYPAISRAGTLLANSGFAFGVNNGSDCIICKPVPAEAPTETIKRAAAFAGQNGYRLGSDQLEANIIIRLSGRATGELAAAKQLVTGLSSRTLEEIFSHHLLDDLPDLSLLDCLALAVADLGIAREDLKYLNWATVDSQARNIRRWTFTHHPDLAQGVIAAERLFPASQALPPAMVKTWYDLKFDLQERLQKKNRHSWGLTPNAFNKAVAVAFPFMTDPIFDPREPIYRRCRQRTFEGHPERAFLAEVYERLTGPNYADVPAADVSRARQIIEQITSRELEKLAPISDHWTKAIDPPTTRLELFLAAFSVFCPSRRKPFKLDRSISERKSEREIIARTIRQLCLNHPQGDQMLGMFNRLNRRETIGPAEREEFRSLLRTISFAEMEKWEVRLPAWLAKDVQNADDLFTVVFPALESIVI